MKKEFNNFKHLNNLRFTLLASAAALPPTAHAQTGIESLMPEEMSMTSYLIISSLLVFSMVTFFFLHRRYKKASVTLQDITGELDVTRQRLSETSKNLETSQQNLKTTSERYQGILYNANTGMFQLDRTGRCTFINTALQEMSGLYPKKALKEGLASAIHSEDKEAFKGAWNDFVDTGAAFSHIFRFHHEKTGDVHVLCHANKVFNRKKEIESYIGWVTDITRFHQEELHQKAITARHSRFVAETIEAFYKLTPKSPLPLLSKSDKMAESIMGHLVLTECNETFAAMYGAKPAQLIGKSINDLKDGCGPFRNNANIKSFIEAGFKSIDLETIQQNPNGNRINLVNNTIGIIEDNHLVGIWGSQRNVSKQKREKEELSSQVSFLHRILNSLPADIHVKDTRCRYLYTGSNLAERTGIPPEEWIGKTIFEVMPGTPRDHDQAAIETMKSGNLNRSEHSYDTNGKSGWMETVQIPLISDDELVEGVIGLSLDITDRKLKEAEVRHYRTELEKKLEHTKNELSESRTEYAQTASSLAEALQNVKIAEAEKTNQEHEFKRQLDECKQTEDTLRQARESLLTRKQQLEEQLARSLQDFNDETAKRKKWEELLAIRDQELKNSEELTGRLTEQYDKETRLREQTESQLKESKTALKQKEHEITVLTSSRDKTAKQLEKTEDLMRKTEAQMQSMVDQHTAEMEHEVGEHKVAAEKLIQTTEELTEFRQQFNQKLDEETNSIKQELAKKTIHEKSWRQQEKDLQKRVNELESALKTRNKEYTDQIEALEKTVVQKQQVEQQLAAMEAQQETMIERETQKLNLNIAEIRLEDVKLRKQVADLQQTREDLEQVIKTRETELKEAAREQKKTAGELSKVQAQQESMAKEQSTLLAKETKSLQDELKQLQKTEHNLLKREEELQKKGEKLEKTIAELDEKVKAEAENRKQTEKELTELKRSLKESRDNADTEIQKQTAKLQKQVEEYDRSEAELKKQAETLQQELDERNRELTAALEERDKAENELSEVIKRASQNAQEIEAQIAEIRQEHENKIYSIRDEQKELAENEKHYRALFQASSDAFLQLNPSTGKIEAANLAAAHLFGEESSAALMDKTLDVLSPQNQPDNSLSSDLAKTRLQDAVETGCESFEWLFRRADESTFHALISFSVIDVVEHQHLLVVVKNISEIKKQLSSLQEGIEEAQAANRLNSKVVEEVNEIVKTSLTPVVTSSAVMEKADNLTDNQKHEVASINRSCRTLIDMMSYRCELSHTTDGSDDVVPNRCDLHDLIKEIDQQFCQRAETKKLFFAVSFAQYQSANNVPKLVEADGSKVHKTLSILLGYALDNTEKGRLGLHATRKAGESDDVTVTFELAYTGKQRDDELLNRIFGDVGDSDDEIDTEYGLSLAKGYIGMLGGAVSLEYRQGGVTALTIDFPFKKVAVEETAPDTEEEKQAGAA